MKRNIPHMLFVGVLLFGLTTTTHARTLELYTFTGFIDVLIERGIIPASNISKAQELTTLLQRYDDDTPTVNGIAVEATQYIEYGTRTYNTFEDVEGLLLRVTNTGDTKATVLRDTRCPVTYAIYSGTEMLYTNKTTEGCSSERQAQYTLEPEESRLFEVTHPMSTYQLQRGTYRFLMQYLDYGSDSVTVTIE